MSKLRILSIVLLFVVLFNVSSIAANAYYTLPVSFIQQEQTNWCWAASSLMTGKYLYPSTTATQTSIVTHVKGSPINYPANILEVADATMYVTNDTIPFSCFYTYFAFSTIVEYIDSHRPIQPLVYGRNSDGNHTGHYYVIYGYYDSASSQDLYIVDPSTGLGLYVSYDDFLDGTWFGDFRPWTQTVA